MEFYGNKDVNKDMAFALTNPLSSYVLQGNEGLGKATLGKIFSKKLLCISDTNTVNGCNCRSCKLFDSFNHPDFIHIGLEDGEKSIKIDQIRDIIRTTHMSPIISRRKVYFVDDANLLTIEAQNALLKTLEEGFSYITFIFVAHKPLLSTINSRSTVFKFRPISKDLIRQAITSDNAYRDLVIAAARGIGHGRKLIKSNDFIQEAKVLFETLINLHSLNKAEFLDRLGLLKEKGESGISESEYLEELLSIVYYFCSDLFKLKVGDSSLNLGLILDRPEITPLLKLDMKIIDNLIGLSNTALMNFKNNLFTKDELFYLFVSLITAVKEGGLKCQ